MESQFSTIRTRRHQRRSIARYIHRHAILNIRLAFRALTFLTSANLALLRQLSHTCSPLRMFYHSTRRRFLKSAAVTGAAFGLGNLSFLSRLPRISAAEA